MIGVWAAGTMIRGTKEKKGKKKGHNRERANGSTGFNRGTAAEHDGRGEG
jgi:hypothetical protein